MLNRVSLARGAALLLSLIAAGCAAAPRERPIEMGPVETGAGSLAAARKYLEGRWSLLSFEVVSPGQPPIRLKGAGTLTYDAFGNLDMEIRVDPDTAARLQAAGISATDGVISTSGRTVVDMNARTLTYVLEGQPASSGPLAPSRPRHWEVDGNVLTLTTRGDDGNLAVARWQKTTE